MLFRVSPFPLFAFEDFFTKTADDIIAAFDTVKVNAFYGRIPLYIFGTDATTKFD